MRILTFFSIFFLSVGICTWLGYGILADSGQTLLYYEDGNGPQNKQLEALEESFPDLSSWYLERNVEVSNKDLLKTHQADCITVYGNKEKAADYGLDSGTYGYRSDEEACMISRGLAMEIFGSVSVAGQAVWCQGERYLVRGVTTNPGCLISIPAKRVENKTYHYLALPERMDGELEGDVEQLLFQRGISLNYLRADGGLYVSAAGLCLLFPIWTLLGCMLYVFYKRRKGEWLGVIAVILFFVLAIISFIFMKLIGFGISQELIPDKWSDFTFLADAIKKYGGELKRAGEIPGVPWLERIRCRLSLLAVASLTFSTGMAVFTWRSSFDT